MNKIQAWRLAAGSIVVPLLTVIAVLAFGLLVICTMFSPRAPEAVKELMEG